jgi:microcystin-dependent protein
MADGVHKYPIDPTLTTGAAGTADGNAGVNLTEGVTQVNAINNAMRGLIGDIGSWRDDVSGANTTTGSANTYVLATTSGLTSLQDGLTLTFLINVTNTGASTLNVDTLGAKKLLASGAALVAGNLVAGQPVTVVYDASADSAAGAWLVLNPVIAAASFAASDISNDSGVAGADVGTALDQLDSDIGAKVSQTAATGSAVIPSGTTAQRDGTPTAGYLRWNSTTGSMEVWDGTEWSAVGGDGGNPAGTVIWFAANTAPTGFLKANGAAISRTTYSDLFTAIGTTFGVGDGSTTFNVPDLRGEFIRGWDDGRGVDSGRAFGSAQADEIESHNHSVDPPSTNTNTTGNHTHTVSITGSSTNSDAGSSGLRVSGGTTTTSTAGNHSHTVNIAAFNSGSTGGSETRPRNVALLACIKY